MKHQKTNENLSALPVILTDSVIPSDLHCTRRTLLVLEPPCNMTHMTHVTTHMTPITHMTLITTNMTHMKPITHMTYVTTHPMPPPHL